MKSIREALSGYKTYLIVALVLLTVLFLYMTEGLSGIAAVLIIEAAFGLSFLRSGVKKAVEEVKTLIKLKG